MKIVSATTEFCAPLASATSFQAPKAKMMAVRTATMPAIRMKGPHRSKLAASFSSGTRERLRTKPTMRQTPITRNMMAASMLTILMTVK